MGSHLSPHLVRAADCQVTTTMHAPRIRARSTDNRRSVVRSRASIRHRDRECRMALRHFDSTRLPRPSRRVRTVRARDAPETKRSNSAFTPSKELDRLALSNPHRPGGSAHARVPGARGCALRGGAPSARCPCRTQLGKRSAPGGGAGRGRGSRARGPWPMVSHRVEENQLSGLIEVLAPLSSYTVDGARQSQ